MAATAALAQDAKLSVPMDRNAVTLVLRLGLQDESPSLWEGRYELDRGRIEATDGWRFAGDDYATTSQFKFSVRRFYPRFWNRRGRDPSSLPMEPNGVQLTVIDLAPSSVLQVNTSRGDFTIPVGQLHYGAAQKALDGQADYWRVPTARQIVRSAKEDGYASAASGANGRLYVSYISFKHGDGFQSRPPIKAAPDDFSYLAKPVGGDQLMFMEMEGDRWSQPVALTEPGGDLFGTSTAVDGQGRVWVFWSANVDDNWDLYGRMRAVGRWSDTQRITSSPGSDFHHAATTDSEGRVWLAWQRLGESGSDILAARQEGDEFGEPMSIAVGEANEWSPAIAASEDGRVAVAWDTYERGDYDVRVKVWRGGRWGAEQAVAQSPRNEARATLAFDREGWLWIGYESSPEGWGKDYGPYDQSPRRTSLYRDRRIGVKVLKDGVLQVPAADVNQALPLPDGRPRWPKSGPRVLAAGPKLCVDAAGRIWLSARIRQLQWDSSVGGTWCNFLTTLDENRWRRAFVVPGTDGFLHESAAFVPAPRSGLWVVGASDGRFRAAAVFGLSQKAARRNPNSPPATTRAYPSYPDKSFNKEITVADTGPLAAPRRRPELAADEAPASARRSPAARAEAQQVAAMRAYRVDVGGESLRLARGEFHRHTEISSDGGGDGSLFDMWRYGLDMASLDWLGCGDHDNGNGREFSWWFTQKTTSIFNAPESFTSMYTYERSCSYPDGHRNAVFARRGIRPLGRLQGGRGKILDDLPPEAPRPNTPDTQMFYRYLRHFDGVCASHTSGTDMGTDWRDNDPKVEPIVEIYQGDRQNYERPGAPRSNSADYSLGGWRPYGFVSYALLKGYRLGFQSSSDHISTHMSYCNVWVDERTRQGVLEGMKRRRVYGATDNIIADVRCGEHFMGEEFAVSRPPTLRVKLIGTAPFAEVVIVKDNEYVYSIAPHEQTIEFEWTDRSATAGETSYYYVRGLQEGQSQKRAAKSPDGKNVEMDLNNGEIVWVSPMWITYSPSR